MNANAIMEIIGIFKKYKDIFEDVWDKMVQKVNCLKGDNFLQEPVLLGKAADLLALVILVSNLQGQHSSEK